jgi:hypothetical protein
VVAVVGQLLFATPGSVHLGAVMTADDAEADAFAVLAAAAWAREGAEQKTDNPNGRDVA